MLLKLKPATLSDVLVSSDNTEVRRHAASWLATQKTQGVQGVNQAVSAAIALIRKQKRRPGEQAHCLCPASTGIKRKPSNWSMN